MIDKRGSQFAWQSPYEFRQVGGEWQRRKPGEGWKTLHITERKNQRGRNKELSATVWTWK